MTIKGIWIPILFIAFALVAQFLTKGFLEDDYKKVSREMDELKPCPFCGGDARIARDVKKKNCYGADIVGSVVYCTVCNAQMFYINERIAVVAWNRRVSNELGK